MNRTLIAMAGLCASLSMFASPALAGPDDKKHAHAEKDRPSLEEIVGKVELPELFIGSKAPELQIAKFVKGDSVQQFEQGTVYVVEFWATWCGPCIAAFPHLSELQAKHQDDLQVIGVNIWERFPDQATRIQEIEGFVAEQGDRMGYTVAVEQDTAMADTWMKPAGQNGIPAAFIVDGTGTIAWVGHPMGMDEPLEAVIAGDFDATDAIEDYKKQNLMMSGYRMFMDGYRSGNDVEKATQIAEILIYDHFQEEPGGLNAVAWTLLNADHDKASEKHHMLAYKASKMACESTKWEEWSMLDTYALAAHTLGKHEEAIKWQTKAIDLAPEKNKAELSETLEKFKSAG
jgi:thiol-disulfide isomerase/thioredoxin